MSRFCDTPPRTFRARFAISQSVHQETVSLQGFTPDNFRKTMHSVSVGCNSDFVHAVMEAGIEENSVKLSGGLPLAEVIGKLDSIRHACATI
jgi:hypothetical protein